MPLFLRGQFLFLLVMGVTRLSIIPAGGMFDGVGEIFLDLLGIVPNTLSRVSKTCGNKGAQGALAWNMIPSLAETTGGLKGGAFFRGMAHATIWAITLTLSDPVSLLTTSTASSLLHHLLLPLLSPSLFLLTLLLLFLINGTLGSFMSYLSTTRA